MQDAAFHRALDQILGGERLPARAGNRRRRPESGQKQEQKVSEDVADRLIEAINRTAYPEVPQATKVLDRSLAVLRLAASDFDIDGLTAPAIARVLTDKFRLRTSRQAVTQALGSAHTMVDTVKRGRTTTYRIMQLGEDHLDSRDSGGEDAEVSRPTSPSQRARRRGGRSRAKKKADSGSSQKQSKPTRRKGPKTAVAELIDEDFFGEARTINQTQEQLRHKKGVRFTLQELSPAFVRLLRDGRLDRDRNASGQYEYRAK